MLKRLLSTAKPPPTGNAADAMFRASKPKGSARSQLLTRMAEQEQQENHKESTHAQKPSPREAIQEIRNDFKQLQATNPFLTVSNKNSSVVDSKGDELEELQLSFSDKPDITFRFVEKDETGIQFECPSGEGDLRVYRYDASLGGWTSEKDGHNMHGLLIRDLLPFLTGLPKFAFKK